jgi:hypothetical protein
LRVSLRAAGRSVWARAEQRGSWDPELAAISEQIHTAPEQDGNVLGLRRAVDRIHFDQHQRLNGDTGILHERRQIP